MKTKYNGKEIKAIIKEFETGEEHAMTITASSSWSVSDEANNLYQKLRYWTKKLGSGVRVTREYNNITLMKTV